MSGGSGSKGIWAGRILLLAAFLSSIFPFCAGEPRAAEGGGGKPDLATAVADIVERAMPAVVHIEVVQRRELPAPLFPFENDSFFRHFFGRSSPRSYRKEMRGIGTGIVIDGEGHILTNQHIVGGATKIMVKISTGEEFEGRMVGADPKTDLAVIRIKTGRTIPSLAFGDSDRLRVGEWVVAIGHPRGLEQTVTAGIISAKHRTGILDPSSYQDFIQTDAAINPGNSGGPLLNLAGEVVGVNAAIVSESGGFEGIGFAIPSNMAVGVAESLIRMGKVLRGWLGVSVQEVTPSLARSLNLKVLKGALVMDVAKGGPAETAGVQPGDVIVSLDGLMIEGANDFRNRVAAARVGKRVELGLVRKGERAAAQAVVATYKPSPRGAAGGSKLGFEVKEISVMEARRKRLDSREGVVVTKVLPAGPASQAGLEPGDIVYQINHRAVRGLGDYHRLLSQIQGNEEVLLLVRDVHTGEEGYVTLIVP